MTITTRNTPRNRKNGPQSGFTLVELIVAMTLSTIIMAGVMSTYLFIVRTGYRTTNYTEMEAQSRKGLEVFARDARSASDITWNSSTSITLTVPTSTSAVTTYLYQFDSTAGIFTRTCTSAGTPAETLISGIDPSSTGLKGYKLTTNPVTNYPYEVNMTDLSQAARDTKQLQLTLKLNRSRATLSLTTSNVISARFILRNKIVTA